MAAPDVFLGVVLEIEGKDIALEPKTPVNKISVYGLEAELPKGTEVLLGSVGGGIQSFVQSVTGDPTWKMPDKKDLPGVVAGVYDTVMTAEITINDLYIKIPPKSNDEKTAAEKLETAYRLGVYVGWPKPQSLIGNLSLKGISIRVDKSATPALPAPAK
ncbi:MAG TPA: hypothetical protein VGL82_02375 [Bryobacteraceae bacterium]|jgi:hypothetical protein